MTLLLPCLLIQLTAAQAHAGPKAHSATAEQSLAVSPRLHLSEQASFLHFVETLSQWSPYCRDVDHGFLGIPEPGESDEVWLQRYAAARRPMGYSAETDLFLWAESGFPLEGRSPGHVELKAAVDHFWGKPEFRDPLARRMKELERFRPSLEEELARLQSRTKALRGVADAFRTKETTRRKEVPIFVMYTLDPRLSQGGANGDGLYTSVDPRAPSEDMLRGQILHEYLHLALRPRERFRTFTESDPHMKAWHQALSSKAPDERGDDETCMLDEILVYALADTVLEGHDPEREMRIHANGGDKQMVRTWDGVRILLPIIRGQLEKPLSSRDFLSQLVGTFVSKVQYGAWSCPEGITIWRIPQTDETATPPRVLQGRFNPRVLVSHVWGADNSSSWSIEVTKLFGPSRSKETTVRALVVAVVTPIPKTAWLTR